MPVRSPERPHSRPGMLRPLAERRSAQPPTTLPGWGQTWDVLMIRLHNHPDFRDEVRDQRPIVREFYDARFALAQGDPTKLNTFVETRIAKGSETYDPKIERLMPVFDAISDRFPGQIDPDASPKKRR